MPASLSFLLFKDADNQYLFQDVHKGLSLLWVWNKGAFSLFFNLFLH